MKKNIFYLITATLFIFVIFFYDSGEAAWIGDTAPDFSLGVLNNKGHLSLKEFQGKIVLINFWATWCGPCKQELPELDKLAKEHKGGDLVILAINIDKDAENTKKFLDFYPVDIPVLIDSESSVVSEYGAMAMPASFIIDEKGIIKFTHLGYSEGDPAVWRKEIDSLLTKK